MEVSLNQKHKHAGFDESEAISTAVVHLKKQYEKVFLVGYSAGTAYDKMSTQYAERLIFEFLS